MSDNIFLVIFYDINNLFTCYLISTRSVKSEQNRIPTTYSIFVSGDISIVLLSKFVLDNIFRNNIYVWNFLKLFIHFSCIVCILRKK